MFSFLVLLVVAGVCGSVGQTLGGYSHGGFLASVVLGFVGAFLGRMLAHSLHLPMLYTLWVGGTAFPIVWSIIGAALFVGAVGMVSRRL